MHTLQNNSPACYHIEVGMHGMRKTCLSHAVPQTAHLSKWRRRRTTMKSGNTKKVRYRLHGMAWRRAAERENMTAATFASTKASWFYAQGVMCWCIPICLAVALRMHAGKWAVTCVNDTRYELAYTRAVARLMRYFKGGNENSTSIELTTPTLAGKRRAKAAHASRSHRNSS